MHWKNCFSRHNLFHICLDGSVHGCNCTVIMVLAVICSGNTKPLISKIDNLKGILPVLA